LERQLNADSVTALAATGTWLANFLEPLTKRLPCSNIELPEIERMLVTLFPTMINFRSKPFYSKTSAVLSAPVIFVLTATLPVVTEDMLSTNKLRGVYLDDDAEAVLHPLDDDEDDDVLVNVESNVVSLGWQRWLTVTHLLLSTLFASIVLSTLGVAPAYILIPIFISVGAALAVLLLLTTSAAKRPRLYWMMCFVGFAIAILWIFIIANEVVGVLQTIGFALQISDAILGLTVFAMVRHIFSCESYIWAV
jgi:sodium/potassium/calcium exchanger 6